MSYIYLIRHGQSAGNVKGGFAGRLDYPLTDLGRKQARMSADFLKDTKLDAVISSTLSRAYETALPFANDRGLEVIRREDVVEMDFGQWEGMSLDEVEEKYDGAVSKWKKDMHATVCPDGESTKECFDRGVKALFDIAKEYDGQDICLVSHGALIKCMLCHLRGLPFEKLGESPWVDNASITLLEYKDGQISIIYEGENSHMGEFTTGVSEAMKKA